MSVFILCAASGVLLAVPYNVTEPYLSVTLLVTGNPGASLIRNIHYWSGQLFLVFLLIHLVVHLMKGYESNIKKKAVWVRLILSLILVFYIMLSGFILKADGDSLQAQRIFSTLIKSIPLIGSMLQQTFIGKEGSLQIMYIQHAATATLIVFAIIMEHVNRLRTGIGRFLIITGVVTGMGFLYRAPLKGLNEETMKGPWYFVGLQETLHWFSNPLIVVMIGFIPLILLLLIPYLIKQSEILKRLLHIIGLGYIMLTMIGLFFRGPEWKWQWPWQKNYHVQSLFVSETIRFGKADTLEVPVVLGHAEGCMSCHSKMKGLSDAHKAEYMGCYSCHGGDPFTNIKEKAHKGMYAVPGNLSNASATCGKTACHPDIVDRVNISLMSSLRGMISVDRWVFGETKDINAKCGVDDIRHSPADEHLRNLCIGCHLGNEKTKPGPSAWLERGGGCNACHLSYNAEALKTLDELKRKNKTALVNPAFHPALDLGIGNDKCKSCHSRSGRISMNYEGWHETNLKTEDARDKSKYLTLPDRRVFVKVTEDVHHQKGMICVDCHGSYEVMGDGRLVAHQEEAVKVQCSDCHTRKAAFSKKLNEVDGETQMISWLHKFKTDGKSMLVTENGRLPLVNTTVEDGGTKLSLIKKSGGGLERMKAPAMACSEGKAHARLTCDACHSAWAPQCIGCHNSYERNTKGFDMLKNKAITGSWVEYAGEGLAEPPVLGIDESDKQKKGGVVSTFAPGMIMTINKGSFKASDMLKTFFRLYAPVAAHTTVREGRSCKSCHNNPLAIGYGRGKLNLSRDGVWTFSALYKNNISDSLPEDAWTGFLKERNDQASTRLKMRPFNILEQKKILTVGACLTCHDEKSKTMKEALIDFEKVKKRMKGKCILPS